MATTVVRKSQVDLWDKALASLTAGDKILLRIDTSDRRKVLEEVCSIVQGAEQSSQEKRWKWKNRKGETVILRDVFAKMVVWIEKFKGIGDNIVQYDPGHAALPWAATRFLLQTAINDVQTNGAMLEGLELVFNLITRFELVERLYLHRPSSVQVRLSEAIIALYASILEYLLKAHQYFTQKTSIRIAKSIFRLEDLTVKFVTTIKSKAGYVDEYVRLVSGEATNTVDRRIKSVEDKLQLLALTTETISTVGTRSAETQNLLGQEVFRLEQILGDLDAPLNRVATQLSAIGDNLRTDERLRIFDWLSSVPYMSHHRSKVKVLLPGSGKWLIRKPEFLEWMNSSTSSILWLHGIPGSGKSMLVAHVIEYIQGRFSLETDSAPLAYFYCSRNSNEPERSDPSELMRSILEQLSCSGEDLPIREPVVEAYKAKKREARGRKPEKLEVDEAVETVLKLLESNPATIVIDGLDECDPAKRQELLDSLETVIADSDNIVKVFVSSRDDHDLVHRLSKTPNLHIRASDNKEDIESFIKTRVDEAVAKDRIICGAVSQNLKETISKSLIQKASGMFRLASLHIDQLCNPERIKTEDNVLSALANLPRDLKKSYDVIMSQILDAQEPTPSLAERILKLLHCSQQGLWSDGFIFLVCSNRAKGNMLKRSDILSICCNLVVYDEEVDQFRFAHLSVREYLDDRHGYSSPEVNALAAEQCLRYLLMSNENKLENFDLEDPSRVRAKLALECHVDVNWARYVQLSGPLRKEVPLKSLLHMFLFSSPDPSPGSTEFREWTNRMTYQRHHELLCSDLYWKIYDNCLSVPPNPLFVASAFDLSEIVAALLPNDNALVVENSKRANCAYVAAWCNNSDTIHIIFDASRMTNVPRWYWHDTLHQAAYAFRLEALRAILIAAGDNFITQRDIEIFAKTVPKRSEPKDYHEVFHILFQSNPKLPVDIVAIEKAIFENPNDSPGIMRGLVQSSRHVVVTKSLVQAAERNHGAEAMQILLFAGNVIHMTLEAICEISLSPLSSTWNPPLLSRMKYMTFDSQTYMEACSYLRSEDNEISLEEARRTNASIIPDLSELDSDQIKGSIELSWEDLTMALRLEMGRDCLLLLLHSQPRISHAAIKMLISYWDPDVVKALLNFQKVEVTKEIIRCAAGNFWHGRTIMQLLVSSEDAEYGD